MVSWRCVRRSGLLVSYKSHAGSGMSLPLRAACLRRLSENINSCMYESRTFMWCRWKLSLKMRGVYNTEKSKVGLAMFSGVVGSGVPYSGCSWPDYSHSNHVPRIQRNQVLYLERRSRACVVCLYTRWLNPPSCATFPLLHILHRRRR